MGGSVGSKGRIATQIIEIAQKLEKEFKKLFKFYKIPNCDDAAIIGSTLALNNYIKENYHDKTYRNVES